MSDVHLFGIRHHGPGSARRVVQALAALRPSAVLIEGPADTTELLPLLAKPKMIPPVALLTYSKDRPGEAVFWPLARYSPEYQAARWALANEVDLQFIDLPAGWRLQEQEQEQEQDHEQEQEQEQG